MANPTLPSANSSSPQQVTYQIHSVSVAPQQLGRQETVIAQVAQSHLPPAIPHTPQQPQSSWTDWVKPWKYSLFNSSAQRVEEVRIPAGNGEPKPIKPDPKPQPPQSAQAQSKPAQSPAQPAASAAVVAKPPVNFTRDVESQIVVVNQVSQPVLKEIQKPQSYFSQLVSTSLNAADWIMNKADSTFKAGLMGVEDVITVAINVYDFPAYLLSYEKELNALKRIEDADRRIQAAIPEPEFLELGKIVRSNLSAALSQAAADKINAFLKDKPFVSGATVKNELIKGLIEVNVANVFANLAEIIKKDPNYPKMNALACLTSILTARIGKHTAELDNIEKAKAKSLQLIEEVKGLMIKDKDQAQKLLSQLLQPEADGTPMTQKGTLRVVKMLFPNYEGLPLETKNKIQDMIKLGREPIKQMAIFGRISEDLITLFFPNKINDLIFPGSGSNVAQLAPLQTFVNGLVRQKIYDFLKESYGPLANNASRHNAWIGQIQERIGNHQVEPLMDAPTVLVTEYARNYIQTNPNAVNSLTAGLDKLKSDQILQPKDQGILPGMDNRPLALYILETLRSIITTEDPALLAAGAFVKRTIGELTLGMVAKGTTLLPKGEKTNPDQFIDKLLEAAAGKLKSLELSDRPQTEAEKLEFLKKAEDFWKTFLHDLPIPSLLQDQLVPILTQRSTAYTQALSNVSIAKKQIDDVYSTSLTNIKKYPKGEQLISLTNNLSTKIIEMASSKLKDIDKFDAINFDDLLNTYLPGIKVDESLKAWFKSNIKALASGLNRSGPAAYAEIVKKAIQTVMLKSIEIVVEKNFKNDPEKFTADLFHRLHNAFRKAFGGLTKKDKQALAEANVIQGQLKTLMAEREAIQRDIEKHKKVVLQPSLMSLDESQTIQHLVRFNDKQLNISNYITSLKKDLGQKLKQLNQGKESHFWDSVKLQKVKMAQAFQKEKGVSSDLQRLQAEKNKLDRSPSLSENSGVYDLLIEVRLLTPEQKNLIKDCLAIEESLTIAGREEVLIKNEIAKNKEHLVRLQDKTETPRDLASTIIAMDQLEALKTALPDLNTQIEELGNVLDEKLKPFHALTEGLSESIGLEQGLEHLPEMARPQKGLIDSIKKQTLSRFLFEQVYPTMLPLFEREQNQEKLQKLTGSPFMGKTATIIAKQIMDSVPDLLMSNPAKELLNAIPLKGSAPTNAEMESINKQVKNTINLIGAKKVTSQMITPYLLNKFTTQHQKLILNKIKEQLNENTFNFESAKKLLKSQMNDKEIQDLVNELDKLVTGFGKSNLTPELLLEAYKKAIPENRMQELSKKDALKVIADQKIVQKIQTVFPIPEALIKTINSVMPGMSDLHSLIAPQIHELIKGENALLKESRDVVQNYIEGMIVKALIRLAEKNGPVNVLDTIAQKVIHYTTHVKGLSDKETMDQIADSIIKEVVGIRSKEDLDGVLPLFRQLVFDIIKEQVRAQAAPYIKPMLDIKADREKLEKLSNGTYLVGLCDAITQDAISWIVPRVVKDYKEVAGKMFKELTHTEPTQLQLDDLSKKMFTLMEGARYKENDPTFKPKQIKNKKLLEIFESVSGMHFDPAQKKAYMKRINEIQLKVELGYILLTPDSIVDSIVKAVPILEPIKAELSSELQKITRLGTSKGNTHVNVLIQQYLESILLKTFIKTASKNPPIADKDVGDIVIDKLLDIVKDNMTVIRKVTKEIDENYAKDLKNARTDAERQSLLEEKNKNIQKALDTNTKASSHKFMKEVLGVESADSFEGMPGPIKSLLYTIINEQTAEVMKKLAMHTYEGIQTLNDSDASVKAAEQRLAQHLGNNAAKVVSNDMGRMVLDSTLKKFTSSVGGNTYGVTVTSEGIRNYLEDLTRKNVKFAKVLLDYSRKNALGQVLEKNIKAAANLSEQDKARAAEVVGNVVLVAMDKGIDSLIGEVDRRKAQLELKLAKNFMNAAAEQFKFINLAKKRSIAIRGTDQFTHADFVAVAGGKLDAAVPREKVSYEKTIKDIENRLEVTFSPDERVLVQKTLAHLADEDAKKINPLRTELVITKLEEILGLKLTPGAVQNIKKPDENGLTLKELIRKETTTIEEQRTEHIYAPQLNKMLKTIFPNGQADLTFVAPEFRGQAWAQLKAQGPNMMHMMIETMLSPDMITNMVLTSLEVLRDNMKAPAKLDTEPYPLELSELDRACGNVMLQAVDLAKLPAWLVSKMKDPKTGEIDPSFQKTFGRVMRNQFNGEFIKNNLKTVFNKMATRTPEGKPFLATDLRDSAIIEAEKSKKRTVDEKRLGEVVHELVDATVDSQLRGKWLQFETNVKSWAEDTYKKMDDKLGWGLSHFVNFWVGVCKHIAIATVGALFSLGHTLTTQPWIKNKIRELINLDENRKIFLDAFRRAPVDQPGSVDYAVYNEQLVFKLMRGIEDALKGEDVVNPS